MSPDEELTILSPLVGTLWQKWSEAGLIEHEAMKELVKIFEKDPHLLFWKGRAADLIWSIYHFDQLGFKFNWGFMSNGTDQFYVLHTGNGDTSRMGEIQRFCYHPHPMSCLQNESSLYIDAWEPAVPLRPGHLFFEGTYSLTENKKDIPPLWIRPIHRNLYLDYNHSTTFKGVELYRYAINLHQMDNVTLYPPNAQYNQYGPSGIMNSTAAYDGVSVFISMGLFYGAPDYMANNSKLGIPNPGPKDYPFLDIEPRTGAVFYANASMQICTPMHSLPNIRGRNLSESQFEANLYNLTDDMMVPMYLVTFGDEVTNGIASDFKRNIQLGNTLGVVSVVLGWISVAFLSIWSVVTSYACGMYRSKRTTKPEN